LSENPDFTALVRQTLIGRIDGAYANVAVVQYNLKQLGKAGALVFDPQLPHTKSAYHLSSVTQPSVITAFDGWMVRNAATLAELRRRFAVGGADGGVTVGTN